MKTIDISEAANLIPIGYENAKTLEEMMIIFSGCGYLDDTKDKSRRTRDIIARVGIDYVVCNLMDGHGYFRPTKKDKNEFRKWLVQEEHRAKQIGRRIQKGKKLFEDYLRDRCDEQRMD